MFSLEEIAYWYQDIQGIYSLSPSAFATPSSSSFSNPSRVRDELFE